MQANIFIADNNRLLTLTEVKLLIKPSRLETPQDVYYKRTKQVTQKYSFSPRTPVSLV